MREIERRLPKAWLGFAAFQLVQRGSPEALDIDLVVLTENRILVIELKNWSGDIEFTGGQWVHKGCPRKSPVKVTQRKAQILKDVIRDKYPKLKVPYVQPVVVLCHPQCRLRSFPPEELAFVLTLGDFCDSASSPNKYKARFPDTPPRFSYPSANPLPDRQHYEALFSLQNSQVLERKTVIYGFQQSSTSPDYVHPRSIWSEFRAEHVDNRRSKALLRKWDFQALAGGGTSPVERATIGLRELRLNEALREQSPELHADLLEPVASAIADDVTTNFIEAYRLPDRVERLEELLARRPDMPVDERIALAKSILSRFAKLHLLDISHRDITKKTLWVIEPARVILSSFAAARVPEARTVGVHRVELETGSISLPEDAEGGSTQADQNPFVRDVFLLGVLVCELLEQRELSRLDGVPLFDDVLLAVAGLRDWYRRAIDWDPVRRFSTASEALDTFNAALAKEIGPVVTAEEISAFKTTASPLNLPQMEELSSTSGKLVYISERDGIKVLVKCWPRLCFDSKHAARNSRLLGFLQQARSLRQSAFDASPEILDFGMGQFGLMLVTRWEDGESLQEWLTVEQPPRLRAIVALSLLNAVRRLHALGLSHGDLKPANVVVCLSIDGEHHAMLLDVPDLSADGDIGITIGILPPHIESASPQHRDMFAVTQLVLSLLDGVDFPKSTHEAEQALMLGEAMPPVDLLAETLQVELFPQIELKPSYLVTVKRRGRENEPQTELEGDNGSFPVGLTVDKSGNTIFFLTGLRQQIVIKYARESDEILDVHAKQIGHEQYVLAARRAAFRLYATVHIEFGAAADVSTLVDVLYARYLATQPDHDEAGGAVVVDPYAQSEAEIGAVRPLSTTELWSALASTDDLNATAVTLRSGGHMLSDRSGQWLLPFDLDGGVLDFSEDERIELLERGSDPIDGSDRWYKIGIVSPDIGKDVMRVQVSNSRFNPVAGDMVYLRGTLERHASGRRVAAMRRVLENGALIPKIPDYFDPSVDIAPRMTRVLDIGSLSEYLLNPMQEEALRTTIEFGPISLLQGPPGTGKTKFIASFVHLVLSKGLARNVLLVSQSHEAVNNALEKVAELARTNSTDISMVRVGLASMVSPRLCSIQEDSKRQLYREAFDAELKERVKAIGYGMGLSRPYVDEAIELHVSLGSVLGRIARLQSGSEVDEAATQTSSVHVERMKEVFCSIALGKFGVEVEVNEDLTMWFEGRLTDLARLHGQPSPDKCKRLEQIINLSFEFSSVLRNPRSNFTSFLARSSSVVAGTCVGIGKHALGIVDHAYDWVIVDEAARASPMELVVAMQAGKRLLLVGDHLQLPPTYPRVVEEKTAQLLGVSRLEFRRMNNFQRAFSSTYGQQVGRTLLLQYRMAENINYVVSNCFYKGTLKVARQPPGPEYESLPDYLSKQVVWIDTADQGRGGFHEAAGTHEGALINEAEANVVLAVIRGIAKSQVFLRSVRESETSKHIPVGIITMYAAQRDLIRRKLDQADWATEIRDLFTIGTVDSYQGKENRIIILSMVRNDTSQAIGFLVDPERINVALSRAKDRLVIISSTSMWSSRPKVPMASVLQRVHELVNKGEALFVPSLDLKRSNADA
ncbi:nuclease-like protein [Fluviicoccus keumensis]|uniref:Nuclease-like protein n=2 Tax=Fluviicoccus keumensis TaxID=1435465 RepID=A0A4V6MG07_9GAMM|nr:nuclease-like protein [Fluviicoccus keumensis]